MPAQHIHDIMRGLGVVSDRGRIMRSQCTYIPTVPTLTKRLLQQLLPSQWRWDNSAYRDQVRTEWIKVYRPRDIGTMVEISPYHTVTVVCVCVYEGRGMQQYKKWDPRARWLQLSWRIYTVTHALPEIIFLSACIDPVVWGGERHLP